MAAALPQRVVCLPGPTGTGKTEAALALAEAFRGAVVNFDSRQVYRGIPIVTAQPSPEEQARCPHLLYGFLDPCEPLSAGRYAELGARAVAEVAHQGFLPLLVGGTGMYLDALLHGLAAIPPVPPAVRAAVQDDWDAHGGAAMHEKLAAVDPAYAAKIHPNDRQRITRALEVFAATGEPFSAHHARQQEANAAAPRYRVLQLGLTAAPEVLAERLLRRIQAMLEAGAEEEMRAAYAACPDREAPGFSGIGCRELIDLDTGRLTRDEALALWLKRTRAYAKRQLTWFKRDTSIRWFTAREIPALVRAAREWLEGEGG